MISFTKPNYYTRGLDIYVVLRYATADYSTHFRYTQAGVAQRPSVLEKHSGWLWYTEITEWTEVFPSFQGKSMLSTSSVYRARSLSSVLEKTMQSN